MDRELTSERSLSKVRYRHSCGPYFALSISHIGGPHASEHSLPNAPPDNGVLARHKNPIARFRKYDVVQARRRCIAGR